MWRKMFVVLITLCVSLSFAETPHTINYQGKLTDSYGVGLNGSYILTFRIYDSETGGTALWSETHSSVSVNKGLFSVVLGESEPINLPFDTTYYLEISIGGEVLSPRIKLSSVPYAMRAAWADSVEGISYVTYVDSVTYIDSVNYIDTVSYIDSVTFITYITYLETLMYIDSVRYIEYITHIDSVSYIDSLHIIDSISFIDSISYIDSIGYVDHTAYADSAGAVAWTDVQNKAIGAGLSLGAGDTINVNVRDGIEIVDDTLQIKDGGVGWNKLDEETKDSIRAGGSSSTGGGNVPPGNGTIPPGYGIWSPNPDPPTGYTYSGLWITASGNRTIWTDKTSVPHNIAQAAIATVDNMIYIIGGYDGSNILNTVYCYDPVTESWSTKAPMTSPRCQMGAAVVDGKIYVVGGTDGASLLASIISYDPTTDEWDTTLSSMPTARQNLMVAASNGRIFAIGGYSLFNHQHNTVQVYDPSADSWCDTLALNTGRRNAGCTTVNDTIYIVGGETDAGQLASIERFIPGTGWETGFADMPTARSQFVLAYFNGALYAIGGFNGSSPLTTNEKYEITRDTWTIRTDIPTARHQMMGCSLDGNIWVFGGYDGTNYLNVNEVYFPLDDEDPFDRWSWRVGMPTARYGLVCGAVNGKIYAIGGGSSGWGTRNECYDPMSNTWRAKFSAPFYISYSPGCGVLGSKIYVSYDSSFAAYNAETNSWDTLTASSERPRFHSTVAYDGKVYEFSGRRYIGGSWVSYSTHCEYYDTTTDAWVSIADIPHGVSGSAAVECNGDIYVLGGYDGSCRNYNQCYHPSTDTWEAKAPMPTARSGLAAVCVKGKIYAIGGYNSSSSGYLSVVERYDPATDSWETLSPMPTERYDLGAAVVGNSIYAIGGKNSSGNLSSNECYGGAGILYFHIKD